MATVRHKLLIVDDEPELCEILALDLEAEGFDVVTASSGNLALTRLRQERFDAVVSDVRMPDGTGIDLLDAVKVLNCETPIVMFVTGFTDMPLEEAFHRGADAVFPKPLDSEKLAAALRRSLTPRGVRWSTDAERQAVRLTIEFHVPLLGQAPKGTKLAETANIGRGGMCVVAHARMPEPGSLVGFKVHVDEAPPRVFEGYGRVRWAKPSGKPSFGLEFLYLDQHGVEAVDAVLSRGGVKAFIPKD